MKLFTVAFIGIAISMAHKATAQITLGACYSTDNCQADYINNRPVGVHGQNGENVPVSECKSFRAQGGGRFACQTADCNACNQVGDGACASEGPYICIKVSKRL